MLAASSNFGLKLKEPKIAPGVALRRNVAKKQLPNSLRAVAEDPDNDA